MWFKWLLTAWFLLIFSLHGEAYAQGLGKVKPDCKGGETLCGEKCKDLKKDRKNCGRCGKRCSSGKVCKRSKCVKKKKKKEKTCPEGMEVGPYTEGNCCWPDQEWSKKHQRCVGDPTCPTDHLAQGQDCLPARTLILETSPPGAQVTLHHEDGEMALGATPLRRDDLPASSTKIHLVLEGFQPTTEHLPPGADTIEMALTLQPTEAPPPLIDEPQDQSSGIGPFLLMGFGGAAVLTSGLLYILAESQRQELRDLSEPIDAMTQVDAFQKRERANDLATGGLTTLVIGSIGLSAGLIWALSQSDESPQIGFGFDGQRAETHFVLHW